MLTYAFTVEVVTVHPNVDDANIIVETTKELVQAEDQHSAEISIMQKFNMFNQFIHRGVGNIELIGSYQV